MKSGFLLSAICGAALCISSAALASPESDANKKLVMEAATMLFIDHKVDQAVDTYFAPDYIQHNPMAATGAAAMRAFFKGFYAGNPDATIEIHHVLADGDLVAIHYLFKFNKQDRGMAVVDIFRVGNGRIQEHWDVGQPVPEKSANSNGMF